MREVVLDTETTGLDWLSGHRIVAVGCVEVVNYVPTGRTFHAYVNPERDVPESARKVHGLSTAFLAGHPVFAAIIDPLLAFLDKAKLIIHNAKFDLGFLNAELAKLDLSPLSSERVTDTLVIARRQFPGAPASLDALCRRFEINATNRVQHGALLDAQLLAACYLALMGGRQPGLGLDEGQATAVVAPHIRPLRPPRPHAPSVEELVAHEAMLDLLCNPLWRQ
jgi:DNA polymerase-3 subunit epsilon